MSSPYYHETPNSNANSDKKKNNHMKVRVLLYASNLPNVAGAFRGTSDPYAVLTIIPNHPGEKPQLIGRTEVIKNTLSPRWTTTFTLPYQLGRSTRFNVGVFDEIRKAKHNKPMGSALYEVGDILSRRGNLQAKKLREGGTLFCHVTALPPEEEQQQFGTLRLSLRGFQLKNVDGWFEKSDPFVEINRKVNTAGGNTWQTMIRTKPVMNDLNPVWETMTIDLNLLVEDADGEEPLEQPLLIQVYDWEKSGRHKTMGQFETNALALMQSEMPGVGNAKVPNKNNLDHNRAFVLKNPRNDKTYGQVIVLSAILEGATENSSRRNNTTNNNDIANIPPISTSSSSTPSAPEAFVPSAPLAPPDAGPQTSNSETMYANITPIPVPVMTGNNGNNNYIDNSNYGQTPYERPPTFVDYLSGGLELELSIAIDYTGSNGDPRKPGTLHYIDPSGTLNEYEKCLTSVGAIIAKYDSNQKFPVFGFGAKFNGQINHCFQVGPEPELAGLGQVLDSYRQVFKTGLTMSGPTVLAEVIDTAAARARSAQQDAERSGQQKYQILLILTDGAVTHIDWTKQALERASDAPLSIVIVGVGRADFAPMNFLDNFAVENQKRDIVQFVEFQRFAYDREALTRETLDEIPDQVVDYFYRHRGIRPLPALRGSSLSIVPIDDADEDIDLSIEFNDDEEIVLSDTSQIPKYDDTQYGRASTYLGGSSAASNGYGSGNVPSTNNPYAYQPAASTATFGVTASAAPPAVVPPQPNPTPNRPPPFSQALNDSGGGYSNSSSGPSAESQNPKFFHVQVPAGVYAGQQLQIQHPKTQQYLIVTVPNGVGPGGKFAVAY